MEHASIMNKKRRVSDQLLEALIYLCAFLAVGLLLGIIGYVFWRGFRTVNWSFLVTEQSPTKGIMGIVNNIVKKRKAKHKEKVVQASNASEGGIS